MREEIVATFLAQLLHHPRLYFFFPFGSKG